MKKWSGASRLVCWNHFATQASPEFPNPEGESHFKDGHYLTTDSHEKMSIIVERYSYLLISEEIPFISLRSTAASLRWGGLYDVSKEWNKSKGHASHRMGIHIDLSTHKVFGVNPTGSNKIAQTVLQRAIVMGTLGHPSNSPFLSDRENPNTSNNHWHVLLNKVSEE